MKELVGICPDCNNVVLVKPGSLFFGCPHCSGKQSTTSARVTLDAMCQNPSGVNSVLQLCSELEKSYGAEVPLQILDNLQKNHPHNEQVAFNYVAMSGYTPTAVWNYLETFADIKKQTPYAEEFLDNTLVPANINAITKLLTYIENKLPPDKQKKYKEKLIELKTDYLGGGKKTNSTSAGMNLMYAYYITCSVINVALVALFVVLPFSILINGLIAIGVFAIEVIALFIHNRVYGNRLDIGKIERLLLVIFMSSIAVAVGGIVIGALV